MPSHALLFSHVLKVPGLPGSRGSVGTHPFWQSLLNLPNSLLYLPHFPLLLSETYSWKAAKLICFEVFMVYNGPTNPSWGLPNSNKSSSGGLMNPMPSVSLSSFMWGKDGFGDLVRHSLLPNNIIKTIEHLLMHYIFNPNTTEDLFMISN